MLSLFLVWGTSQSAKKVARLLLPGNCIYTFGPVLNAEIVLLPTLYLKVKQTFKQTTVCSYFLTGIVERYNALLVPQRDNQSSLPKCEPKNFYSNTELVDILNKNFPSCT